MNFSEENHVFWSILEEDLSTNIPDYIKYNFTLFGYGIAASIKNLKEEEISNIQEMVRTKVLSRLQSDPYKSVRDNGDYMLKHFGAFFVLCPDEFEFMPGDKHLIRILVQHVNTIINHNGYSHFQRHLIEDEEMNRDDVVSCEKNWSHAPVLLKKLLESWEKNSNRSQQGYRYSDEIKKFVTYVRMISGPLAYQTIQKNLRGAFPSLQSINRYIQRTYSYVSEGILRSNELLLYLTERKLPLVVSLSEDATRILGRPQYDRKTNQIVGFTLPVNQSSGLPIPFSYPARNFREIGHNFTHENAVSAYVNIVVAQPICNAQPFCLLVYGFDNKHDSKEVLNRWETIKTELKSLNIKILSISTDSDPRYNSAMRIKSKLGRNSKHFEAEWFSCDPHNDDPILIQDTIHIGTKIRNFLLRTLWNHFKLQFGNCFINMNHLKAIMENFSKDKHELTPSVLNPVDRQNFPSVMKICSEKVTSLLKSHVKGSEGTAKFLDMARMILDSFLSPDVEPIERVKKIWYSLFMLRMWRNFVVSNKHLTLEENFMTANCYACIELNAHGLVHIILRLKDLNSPHLFLPFLFASQPCESTFRQVRSFTSTFSTVVNCTVKEILERITKIQLQNDYTHSLSNVFEFPRLGGSKSFPSSHFELPSKEQIYDEIKKCMQSAIFDAKKFGLISATTSIEKTQLPCGIKELELRTKKKSNEIISCGYLSSKLPKFKNIKLKNYSSKFINESIDETGPYVEVYNSRGRRIVVKKVSLCWMLRKDSYKLSSDRTERVKTPSNLPKIKRNKNKTKSKKVNEKKKVKCLLYGHKKAKISFKK